MASSPSSPYASVPKVIVFDFDGVIVESNAIKDEAFGHVFLGYGAEAAQEAVRYHLSNHGQSRYEKISATYHKLFRLPIAEDLLAKLGQDFSDFCLDRILNCPMVPGALEFLAATHQRHALAVASATPESELLEIVEARGLGGYFEMVLGKPASKEDNLRKILLRYEVAPEDTVFVGDQVSDLAAAREVGIPFVGRISGGDDHPFRVRPDLVTIEDLVHLSAVLNL